MGKNIINRTPKVFISYSWSSETIVVELSERLISDGIDVVLDKYELKEGQDKYAFMERCIADPSIDKVLIICDKLYAEKANLRKGGVGDETQIITPEIFGKTKQERFIPIVVERDDENNPYLPTYIKSRIHIDLSDETLYENNYEKLLRNIYNKPAYTKPQLGKAPEWLDNNTINATPIKKLLKQLDSCVTNNTKTQIIVKNFIDEYVNMLLPYNNHDDVYKSQDSFFKVIDEFKIFRDYYTDFLEILIKNDMNIVDILPSLFEDIYNKTHEVDSNSYYDNPFEHFDYLIWEIFISTTAILLHYEKYKEIYGLLNHSYFIRENFFKASTNVKDRSFIWFRKWFHMIEEVYKANSQNPRLYTLAGEILVKREKKPILTSQKIAEADILLFQLSFIIDFTGKSTFYNYWFPTTYIYATNAYNMWIRLKSKKYCTKIFPLFGVSSIDELKMKIEKSKSDKRYNYPNSFDNAPTLNECIKIEEIASIN